MQLPSPQRAVVLPSSAHTKAQGDEYVLVYESDERMKTQRKKKYIFNAKEYFLHYKKKTHVHTSTHTDPVFCILYPVILSNSAARLHTHRSNIRFYNCNVPQ